MDVVYEALASPILMHLSTPDILVSMSVGKTVIAIYLIPFSAH
jgi:hypothetical protein